MSRTVKYMFAWSLLITIALPLIATTHVIYAATLNITVGTSKLSYQLGEDIRIYGDLKYNSVPVQDNSVGLQVKDPLEDIVVSRTLQTNASGGYSLTFQLLPEAEPGTYQVFVSATYKGQQSTSSTTFQYEYEPTMSITPANKVVGIGEEFSVNVTLDHAEDLYGFEFWLSFGNSRLNATAIDYMDYLNEPTMIWNQNINNTSGYVALAVSSLYPATGKTGGGELATIRFKSLAVGTSPLHLYKTHLVDDKAMEITHTTADGTVLVTLGEIHDIAVTDVTPLKTVVGEGYQMHINVTAANQGDYTETFNVTVYANTTVISQTEVTLTSGNSTTVTLTWDTTGFAKGNYTIWAYAWPVPGETGTADNTLTDGWVIVAMVGDVNGPDGWPDGKVDMIYDIRSVAKLFGVVYPDPKYVANYDINDDGKIDMINDIRTVAKHFGDIDP